jgi:uncharacterized surface protein with fasciclin (FAS1) repeats
MKLKQTGLIFQVMLIAGIAAAQAHRIIPDTVNIDPPGKKTFYAGINMVSTQNIIQNLRNAKEYSIFLSAINAAHLRETFSSKGPLTVFAPRNDAFAQLSPGKLDTLLKPSHQFELISLLTYHAIPGAFKAKDLVNKIKQGKGQAVLITVAGSKLVASLNESHNIVLTDENGGQTVITIVDIKQINGVMHLVDRVLLPKYKTI